jgi:hypothetical protein
MKRNLYYSIYLLYVLIRVIHDFYPNKAVVGDLAKIGLVCANPSFAGQ